jgi:hypothetical protein
VFLDSIREVTLAQWNFKPAPNRWSIAECAEHIAVTDPTMLEWIRTVLSRPAVGRAAPSLEADQMVLAKSIDRTVRQKAPKSITPTGRWKTPDEVAEVFRKHREETIRYVQTTQDPLRAHVSASKTDPLDGFQLLLTIAGHTERHVAQINEVKSLPGYPRE